MEAQNTELVKAFTRIGTSLIITFPAELTDEDIREIAQSMTAGSFNAGITGAILRFSKVGMMDAYMFGEIIQMSRAISLMGVRVVWTGLSPGVVCALVDSGALPDMEDVETAASLDQGLALLARPAGREGQAPL